MKRELILTDDGSHTLFIPEMGEHYHSVHGALQESRHIFIDFGYHKTDVKKVSILEVGFGTGLNALLTLLESYTDDKIIRYETWEAYPLTPEEYNSLNYSDILNGGKVPFNQIHEVPWEIEVNINPRFVLKKVCDDIRNFHSDQPFDLVYFDAFGPDYQPELWSVDVFTKIGNHMNRDSILVTYSAKGQVRRNLREAGFLVEKAPGPPGKREISIAIKQ